MAHARSIGYSAGSHRRRAAVGGCIALPTRGASIGAVTAEPLKARGSLGFSGGSSRRNASRLRRVPPPTRPAGRFGGRGGVGYRYPGSNRPAMLGALRTVGNAKCVPCSQRAISARG